MGLALGHSQGAVGQAGQAAGAWLDTPARLHPSASLLALPIVQASSRVRLRNC
jgi:hypothetical protein